MKRIIQLDNWLDAQFAQHCPRTFQRLAWLKVRTNSGTGPQRSTVIIIACLPVIGIGIGSLITLWLLQSRLS